MALTIDERRFLGSWMGDWNQRDFNEHRREALDYAQEPHCERLLDRLDKSNLAIEIHQDSNPGAKVTFSRRSAGEKLFEVEGASKGEALARAVLRYLQESNRLPQVLQEL